ncbi:MAG TPA: hypothetical protein PLE14_01210, partial [Anaerolineales bacterium]|nr:hypothetical protein [Anaerolineales bacterium]
IKEIAPRLLPVFERIIKTRKNLRITNPAMLMRSFIGMVVSFMITEMLISNSILSKVMPKNPIDAYVDVYMHGIIKETV